MPCNGPDALSRFTECAYTELGRWIDKHKEFESLDDAMSFVRNNWYATVVSSQPGFYMEMYEGCAGAMGKRIYLWTYVDKESVRYERVWKYCPIPGMDCSIR